MSVRQRVKDKSIGAAANRISPPPNVPHSTNDKHPAFCFKYIQKGFTADDCDKDAKASLLMKMYKLSPMSWGNIQKASRKGSGHEIINQASINVPLPSNTPADREFLSFRLGMGGNSVFIGYRKDKVFYILWIDPNGKVYDHK